jgi:hypothetical protein
VSSSASRPKRPAGVSRSAQTLGVRTLTMLGRLFRFVRHVFGERGVTVERETSEYLELRYGSLRTVFDRTSEQVSQNGKIVALLPLVERVHIHRPPSQEGRVNWFITVQVQGGRHVHVGQATDDTDASIVGAHIATVTKRPVTVES